jgi:hypothetical protein
VKFRLLILFLSIFAMQGVAAADEWDWNITPYLWAAGIDGDTSIGPIEANISVDFEDLFNVLRGGALLRAEGMSERHGVFGDLVYLRLKEKNARDTIGGSLEVKMDTLIVEGAYFYRFNPKYALELGLRYWDFETTLVPAVIEKRVSSSDWTDAFVGFRMDSELSSRWSWLFRGNVGGGGSEIAAGLQLDFRRKFQNGNRLDIGLRLLDVERQDDSGRAPTEVNASFQGLAVGYSFDL